MKRYLRIAAAVATLAVVAAACGGGGGETEPGGGGTTEPGTGEELVAGGTLRAVMGSDFFNGLDPQQEYYSVSWEFLRCCMARTLMSYNGKPVTEGGSTPAPDLADGEPTVSEDGLTWTFTIKDGVMFGDPLNREIVAQDFVNAFSRFADPEINSVSYPFYFGDIVGFDEAGDEGGEVSGVVAVDDKTLEIQLERPNQDVPYLVAMPAAAPLPQELMDTHYKAVELGQFLVSSGPYQWEGMKDFDLSSKKPPSGMDITRSYIFERNPSYDPETDDLREGWVDRIEIAVGGETQDLLDKVANGDVDWCIDCGVTSTELQRFQADTTLYNPDDPSTCDPQPCRLQIHQDDVLYYYGLNVFQPPMDDVHVRKALNWVIDKAALYRLAGGTVAGEIATHFIPSGMLGGLLADYNPYPSEDFRGDEAKAKEEMAQSKYDTDSDGMCDAPECTVQALTIAGDNDAVKAIETLGSAFSKVGIRLEIVTLQYNALVKRCATLASHTAFCNAGWGKDYPSPFTYFEPLLNGGENGSNYAFMGTSAEALEEAGYEVPAEIPSIDEDIKACAAIPVGPEQDQCWADLDVKVMEEIVPIIPRRFGTGQDVLGERLVSYSYDQFAGIAAVDRLALANGGA
jgi:peptide/nickel transport system substrate-binding protein